MAIEIERKFLVKTLPDDVPEKSHKMIQGYIARDNGNTVRIRQKDDRFILTIKSSGRTSSLGQNSKYEIEYDVSPQDAAVLFECCPSEPIVKTRHIYRQGGFIWEVDVFAGDNEGLIVAEVELQDELDAPELPAWIGPEVSGERRFFNAALYDDPFSGWGKTYAEILAEYL